MDRVVGGGGGGGEEECDSRYIARKICGREGGKWDWGSSRPGSFSARFKFSCTVDAAKITSHFLFSLSPLPPAPDLHPQPILPSVPDPSQPTNREDQHQHPTYPQERSANPSPSYPPGSRPRSLTTRIPNTLP